VLKGVKWLDIRMHNAVEKDVTEVPMNAEITALTTEMRSVMGKVMLERCILPATPIPRKIDKTASAATGVLSAHMELEALKDLYIHELKDLYSAEKQLIKALPRMAKAATNDDLIAGFEEHLEQTKEHAERLEKILDSHDESTRGPKCKGSD
jgi:hypothetical protein